MTPLVLALTLAASPATDKLLAAEGITVAAVATLPATLDDPAWSRAAATDVPVVPQRALTLNDKDANAARTDRSPGMVSVRALATRADLALLCEWGDVTENRIDPLGTDAFADGIAVEVPVKLGAERLPYVGMGDEAAPVLVHFARAGQKDVVLRTAVAAGFGSLTRADVGWVRAALRYDAEKKRWRALFVRPLVTAEHQLDAAIVPVAFALWDGARDQRGGNKLLSGWRLLRMPNQPVNTAQLEALAFGYGPGDVGDPARGRALVDAICVACHRIGDKQNAPVDMAPDLSNIGVLSSYGYLRDSMLAPNTIVVPVLRGARTMQMPPFPLPKEQQADVLAYLKTLGATP